jgi:hypothetical protein
MVSSFSSFGSEPGPLLLRCSGGTGGIFDISLSSLDEQTQRAIAGHVPNFDEAGRARIGTGRSTNV